MNSPTPCRNKTYDHRIQNLVCTTGNPYLFRELKIPRSTVSGWIQKGPRHVVSLDLMSKGEIELQCEILKLRQRVTALTALLRLVFTVFRVMGVRLDGERLPEGKAKIKILHAAKRASKYLPLKKVLNIIHLSNARYHRWKRADECKLDDKSSCPITNPIQVTPKEKSTIRDMFTSKDYRHMSIKTLALYAGRIGKVFISVSTWYKLVRQHGWKRPRKRLYPEKPKIGIRATKPNEYWHIDVTIIKLLDGTKAYLHAVIDNFSRRILAWKLSERLAPMGTCDVLLEATRNIVSPTDPPMVVTDKGIENVNNEVDSLIKMDIINRILAQIEVSFSNSMIEAWWRSLKYQWLYINSLDNIKILQKLIAFYVEQHNSVMPHSAFLGQTPDEMYFGTGKDISQTLTQARIQAREKRMQVNRDTSCDDCDVKGSAIT